MKMNALPESAKSRAYCFLFILRSEWPDEVGRYGVRMEEMREHILERQVPSAHLLCRSETKYN